MKVAALFPGHAALEPGPAAALLKGDARGGELLARASGAVGVDLGRALARGGPRQTELQQPLLAVVCLVAWRALGIRADLVAGHSFGELVALGVAAGWTDEGVVDLAVARGRIFAELARAHPGGLVALTTATGFTPEDAPRLADFLAEDPELALAAVNAPTERVVSGSEAGLKRLLERFGGRRLEVDGPWHHPVMQHGADVYAALLSARVPAALGVPFVSGLDGVVTADGLDAAVRVAAQTVGPVRWDRVLARLADEGVTHVVCVGAERTLRGLVRWNGWRDVVVLPAVDPPTIARAAEILAGAAP